MSYDLMVFEPEAAPKDHKGFIDWYMNQMEEACLLEDVPVEASISMKNFFAEISLSFPPLNGSLATEELPEDEGTATDYSLSKDAIYACFAWSKAEHAYKTMFDLAAKYGLGFFNVSSEDGEVWIPQGKTLKLAYSKSPPSSLNRLITWLGKN